MAIYPREDARTALPQLEKRIAELEEKEKDYVVEQGTDGIWTYRKWASGVSECWGETGAITLTPYTAFGSFNGYMTTINFPQGLFIDIPYFTYSAYIGSGFALTGTLAGASSATYANVYALATASGSQGTTWKIIAKGRWK